jgi:hypothetical protein
MRADNSNHLIAAAQQRSPATRQRAAAALIASTWPGNRLASTPWPARRTCLGPNSAPNPTCAQKSNVSEPKDGPHSNAASTRPRAPARQRASAPARQRILTAISARHRQERITANSEPTTSAYGKPSATADVTPTRRRHGGFRQSPSNAEPRRQQHRPRREPQVTALILSLARDNDRVNDLQQP